MEPASLLAYHLQKLASQNVDEENRAQIIRRLLETDRGAHTSPALEPAGNLVPFRRK